MKELLVKYTDYNLWANQLVCDFIGKNLSEHQLDDDIPSSFPSVKKTLFHIWDAETIWLTRLHGLSLTSWPSNSFSGTTPEAIEGLLLNSRAISEFIASKENSFFATDLHYTRVNGEKYVSRISDVVQHVVNHSSYHRGQIITMLRVLGFTELFSTDYINFSR